METAIVLGTFDGLHAGHRAVIGAAEGYYTVAITFALPPKAFLGGSSELLMLPEDKEQGLRKLGVSEIMTLDFKAVSNLSEEEFFGFIKKKYSPALIACGFNYRFGKGAKGDAQTLMALCNENKIAFRCIQSVGGDDPVSSSALRAMIANGEVDKANSQIFGGFGFTAPVLHGDSRGKIFGFPTANQEFPEKLVKPKFGVYKSKIIIDGIEYESITNLGVRPTYMTDFIGAETYIAGFDGEIYGKPATLKLLEFVRCEEKFSSCEALESAVKADIKSVLGIEL
ncbi:MAG: hypothetical protein IKZ59_04840 [Clostridia bacterium]|nr:hypothetical protein [Clostridia bacterium]